MAFFGLFRSRRYERAGFEIYTAAVQAAREPQFYSALQVPDTLDGRFDMVGLYVFLVIHRMRNAGEKGKALGQAVFDAMFSDMDFSLREIGVSDMRIGKKIKEMWEAFHGRSTAYATALVAGDREALAAAIGRNVWRGDVEPGPAHALADLAMAQSQHLLDQPVESLLAGRIAFLPAAA